MIKDQIRRSVLTPWIGLIAPPIAWAIHHRVALDLVFFDCRLGEVWLIALLGAVMGLISAASGLISWVSRPATPLRELRTYVAYLGAMTGAVFCLAMACQTLATLLLEPCHR